MSTDKQLFAVLRDTNADIELRVHSCYEIIRTHRTIDRRRAVQPLLSLLQSADDKLRIAAIRALGILRSKRAVDPLLQIALNKAEVPQLRIQAVEALCMVGDERILSPIRAQMFDTTEDIRVRSAAIEWLPSTKTSVQDYVELLSDTTPDIRFWAAFRLSQSREDITPSLHMLDQIAAFDHTLPQTWGWHVDREALMPLECIYFRPFDSDERDTWPPCDMRLISPLAEYDRFTTMYRKWREDWFYETSSEPTTDFRLDSDWLKDAIAREWPEADFDVRQPAPQTYDLNWHIQLENQHMIGGLHRDRYAVVITGHRDSLYTFAAWYRNILPLTITLYCYDWADSGIELKPGITPEQIADFETMLFNERL